jgi:hypothetical protein
MNEVNTELNKTNDLLSNKNLTTDTIINPNTDISDGKDNLNNNIIKDKYIKPSTNNKKNRNNRDKNNNYSFNKRNRNDILESNSVTKRLNKNYPKTNTVNNPNYGTYLD